MNQVTGYSVEWNKHRKLEKTNNDKKKEQIKYQKKTIKNIITYNLLPEKKKKIETQESKMNTQNFVSLYGNAKNKK